MSKVVRTNFTAPANVYFNQRTIMLYSYNQHNSSKQESYKAPALTNEAIMKIALLNEYQKIREFLELSNYSNLSILPAFYYFFHIGVYNESNYKTPQNIKEDLDRYFFSDKKSVYNTIIKCLAVQPEENSEYCFMISKGYTFLKDVVLNYRLSGKKIFINTLIAICDFYKIKQTKTSTVASLLQELELYFYNVAHQYNIKAKNIIKSAIEVANKIDVTGKIVENIGVDSNSEVYIIANFTKEDFDEYYSVSHSIQPKLYGKPVQVAEITYVQREITNNQGNKEIVNIPVFQYKPEFVLYKNLSEYKKANNLSVTNNK